MASKPTKPRPPLQKGSRFERKLAALRLPCSCWSCVRARGLTPPRALADRHTDYPSGTIFRVDNGKEDHQLNLQKKKEAQALEAAASVGLGGTA